MIQPWEDFSVDVDGGIAYMTYRPHQHEYYGLQVSYRDDAELAELSNIGRFVLADDAMNEPFARVPLQELYAIDAYDLRRMVGR